MSGENGGDAARDERGGTGDGGGVGDHLAACMGPFLHHNRDSLRYVIVKDCRICRTEIEDAFIRLSGNLLHHFECQRKTACAGREHAVTVWPLILEYAIKARLVGLRIRSGRL